MRWKCRDCGNPLPDKPERSRRSDVCDGCWDTRMAIVTGAQPLTADEFATMQRKMASGRGTAARYLKARAEEELAALRQSSENWGALMIEVMKGGDDDSA